MLLNYKRRHLGVEMQNEVVEMQDKMEVGRDARYGTFNEGG